MPFLANALKRLRVPLDGGEINALSFWVSQLLMILATILGVYLAASEGLKAAVQFNEISRLERNYYLRTSLANELETNVSRVNDYAVEIQRSPPAYNYYEMHPLELDLFIWNAMQESDTTLETPSPFLNGTQHFYRSVLNTYERLAAKTYGHSHGAGLLQQSAERVSQSLLPALRENTSRLAERLSQYGVKVETDETD